MQTEISMFLQSLRGAQAMIVLAYLMIRRAMTIDDLCGCTGLGDDSVRAAVKGMASKGLLYKQVGEHGRVLWVPQGDTLFSSFVFQNPTMSDSEGVVNDDVHYKLNAPTITTTTSLTGSQSPTMSDSGRSKQLSDDEFACLEALKEAGIQGKKARSLVKLDWVTPEYIRAHYAQIQNEEWDNPQGMMIYRIEGEEPAQEVRSKGEFMRQTIDKGKRGKESLVYDFDVEQHIADFMEHEKGCKCMDCRMLLSAHGDTRIVCGVCRHYVCECGD